MAAASTVMEKTLNSKNSGGGGKGGKGFLNGGEGGLHRGGFGGGGGMTGRIMHALLVPPVVPYKALEKFSKALYGTTVGTYSPRVFPSCHVSCS